MALQLAVFPAPNWDVIDGPGQANYDVVLLTCDTGTVTPSTISTPIDVWNMSPVRMWYVAGKLRMAVATYPDYGDEADTTVDVLEYSSGTWTTKASLPFHKPANAYFSAEACLQRSRPDRIILTATAPVSDDSHMDWGLSTDGGTTLSDTGSATFPYPDFGSVIPPRAVGDGLAMRLYVSGSTSYYYLDDLTDPAFTFGFADPIEAGGGGTYDIRGDEFGATYVTWTNLSTGLPNSGPSTVSYCRELDRDGTEHTGDTREGDFIWSLFDVDANGRLLSFAFQPLGSPLIGPELYSFDGSTFTALGTGMTTDMVIYNALYNGVADFATGDVAVMCPDPDTGYDTLRYWYSAGSAVVSHDAHQYETSPGNDYSDYMLEVYGASAGPPPEPPTPEPPLEPSSVFPTLPGLAWDVRSAPQSVTSVQRSASGLESRALRRLVPLWNLTWSFEFLRKQAPYEELQELLGFFLDRRGREESFLLLNPQDSVADGQLVGVGDGDTTDFQLVRSLGPHTADVMNVATVTSVTVGGTQVFSYTVGPTGLLSLGSAPSVGREVRWSGTYYYRCRFLDDANEVSNFMQDLFMQRQIAMRGSLDNRLRSPQ